MLRTERSRAGAVGVFAGFIAASSATTGDWFGAAMMGPLAIFCAVYALWPRSIRHVLYRTVLRSSLRRRPAGAWPLTAVYSEHGREVLETADRDPLLRAEVTEHVDELDELLARRIESSDETEPLVLHYRLLGYLEGVATGTREAITRPGVYVEPGMYGYSFARLRLAALCQLAIRDGLLRADTGVLIHR